VERHGCAVMFSVANESHASRCAIAPSKPPTTAYKYDPEVHNPNPSRTREFLPISAARRKRGGGEGGGEAVRGSCCRSPRRPVAVRGGGTARGSRTAALCFLCPAPPYSSSWTILLRLSTPTPTLQPVATEVRTRSPTHRRGPGLRSMLGKLACRCRCPLCRARSLAFCPFPLFVFTWSPLSVF
jgi:hypothetical protein